MDQKCKIHWLRSLSTVSFWRAIVLDLQGQIWLKKSNFLASQLLGIHNHHITTREPWVPRLLHRPDCFMVSILCMYLYTYTVSRSWLFHSLNTLHVHWSRQPRVFRHLTSFLLTHWARDKMDAISKTTFSSAFSWMKMFEFRLKFHWGLFLRVQLTIFHHWFRWWLGTVKATSHCLNQWLLACWRI